MIITLKDGSTKEYSQSMAIIDIAKDISEGLARVACAAKLNDDVVDLRTVMTKDGTLEILTFDTEEGKKAYRHTASHILAQAVTRLYPETKLAIGPAIKDGFYYDFDRETPFNQDEFAAIEKEMNAIIKEAIDIERYELSRDEAIRFMKRKGESYKVQLIEELPEDAAISFYQQGEFTDLCAGPHLMNTKAIKAIKLLSTGGAYWKGSEKNKMLSRIYGTAFTKKKDLNAHVEKLEDAKKRDHNKLGRELELFTTSDIVGQGLPLLMPKGTKVVQILQRFTEDTEEAWGYQYTKTPIMAKSDLYKVSGHWDHYKDGMFVLGDEDKDEEVLALRPMTCPFQYIIYNAKPRSYRDLPIRYAETSPLFRKEASGEMHGLIRVRQFTLADAHIMCMPEQVEQEFKGVVSLIKYIMTAMGIQNDVTYRFSKWDPNNREKYIDDPEAWESTESIMRDILDDIGLDYVEAMDEAAFYGPKLDVQFVNVHGKEDTLFTVQIDFAIAERFGMVYTDRDGQKKTPYIIHRSSIGCYERTLAMLIEKYAGAFPTWIAPTQVKILSISDKNADYANDVAIQLRQKGLRVEVDNRTEKIGYKIREARLERLPYIVIVGQSEQDNGTIALRSRKNGDEGETQIADFIARIKDEVDNHIC